jgi:sugar O-acyltransferase (sialic acid O-acetyltransferase NeuD family)
MTRPERILLVGSSGHAKVVIDVAEKAGFEIVGLIDRFRAPGEETLGHVVLGAEEQVAALVESRSVTGCFVAIGDNHTRGVVVERLRLLLPTIRFVSLIHPAAIVARDVTIGEGTVVMGGAIINTSTRIGRFCLINTAAAFDHDGQMDDFASLAPGARTGGNVGVGTYSAVGIGATISHGVRIGAQCVIGAGATVLRNIDDNWVAYGTPARVVRLRAPGDTYL